MFPVFRGAAFRSACRLSSRHSRGARPRPQSNTLAASFHLDEYLGFGERHPQSFRLGVFHGLRGDAVEAAEEYGRYAALLKDDPPDFALIAIGENRHLAFNDPPVADFQDPFAMKVVELDEASGGLGNAEQSSERRKNQETRRLSRKCGVPPGGVENPLGA